MPQKMETEVMERVERLGIDELTQRMQQWCAVNVAPETRQWREWGLTKLRQYGHVSRISEITPEVLERVKAGMLGDGFKPKSVNHMLRGVSACINTAAEQGWWQGDNPCKKVRMLRVGRTLPRFLKKTEAERLLRSAKARNHDIYAFVALGLYAGLRHGEIDACRWDWINFEQRYIEVQEGNGFKPKGHDARTIPLSAKLSAVLDEIPRSHGYIVAPAEQRQKPRYRYWERTDWREVTTRAKVPWATPHTLRHTFASLLVQANVSLFKVTQWLGHADPTTTMIYAHLNSHDDAIDHL